MPLSGLTVLMVDDNDAHNYALSRMLEQKGHCSVLRAFTGEQAISLAFEHKPDAILLDVNLPDVNGWEVCRRIREEEKLKTIPIVFLTATFQSTSAKDMARSVGANNLLFYPVENEQLFAVIRGEIARTAKSHKTSKSKEH